MMGNQKESLIDIKPGTESTETSYVIVLGMHRSGTSMLTNIIEKAGYYVGPKNDLIAAAADNEKGFFERVSIAQANDLILQLCGASWDNPPRQEDIERIKVDPFLKPLLRVYNDQDRAVIKDPRMCLTFPVWKDLISKNLKFVYITRDPEAVAASLQKRNKFDPDRSRRLYDEYNAQAAKLINDHETFEITYEDLFTDRQDEVLSDLATFLGASQNLVQLGKSIIDPRLDHYSAEKKRPLVSIVMLTYNAIKYTQECVDSIQANTSVPHEIIFVDNGSKDGSVKYLRRLVNENSNYKLIENKFNRGFAGGNNQGVDHAQGKYVLLLNNDVLVGEGWLDSMVRALELDDHIGMVGPITNHISGRQMVKEVPYSNSTEFYDFSKAVARQNWKKITPRRRIAGFAVLMEKSLYQKVGGLDESFGSGNFEDDDLCLKVREAGYAIMVDEGVFIHHYGSQTFIANEIDYSASLQEKGGVFQEKWPDTDYDELIETKNPLSDLHPRLFREGMAKLETGDYESAYQIMEQLVSENPLFEEALSGLAMAAKALGQLELALSALKRLITTNPDHAIAYNLMGLLAAETGDNQNAKQLFQVAMSKDNSLLDAQRNYAEVLLLNDEFQEGIQALLNIIEQNPEDVLSLSRMADLNLEAGRVAEAESFAHRIMQVDPQNELAQQIVGAARS